MEKTDNKAFLHSFPEKKALWKKTLLLASKSPRRRELLKMLDMDYRIVEIKDVDEIYPTELEVEKVPSYLSRLKAEAYLKELMPEDILITADTVVILDNKIIGKPKDLEDAKRMLRKLSGRVHKVITGVTIASREKIESFSTLSEVKFAQLSDAEIDYYVETYRPLDKAGAYGIQEWIGAVGVEGIIGSFYNVMGLPIHHLYRKLINSFA